MTPQEWAQFKGTVYRAFDAGGGLLYIGYTADFEARQAQHVSRPWRSWWVSSAARWELEEYPSRDAALAAEALAICTEKPAGNVVVPAHPDHEGCRLRQWENLKGRVPQLREWCWPPATGEHIAAIVTACASFPLSDEVRAKLAALLDNAAS